VSVRPSVMSVVGNVQCVKLLCSPSHIWMVTVMTYVVTYVAHLYQIEVPVSVPDRLAEGMRELETILDKREVVLCAPLLLIYAHKRCKTIGKLGIRELYGVLAMTATYMYLLESEKAHLYST